MWGLGPSCCGIVWECVGVCGSVWDCMGGCETFFGGGWGMEVCGIA